MSDRKDAIGLKVSPGLQERVEQYQESEGMSNRSDALRDLLKQALDQHENPGTTITLPMALTWFGSIMLALAVTPTSPSTGTLLTGGGILLMALGVLVDRQDQ